MGGAVAAARVQLLVRVVLPLAMPREGGDRKSATAGAAGARGSERSHRLRGEGGAGGLRWR